MLFVLDITQVTLVTGPIVDCQQLVSTLRVWARKRKRAMFRSTCLLSSSSRYYLGFKWGGPRILLGLRFERQGHPCMIRGQFMSVCPRICTIQLPSYRTQALTQIHHKVL